MKETLKIFVLGLGKANMETGWPHHNFDVVAAMEGYRKKIEKPGELRGINFSGYTILPQKESNMENEIIQLLDKFEEEKFDGILVINLTSEFASLGPSICKILDSGLPTVVYTKPFSTYWDGSGMLYTSEYKVEVCASENIEDIFPIFDVIKAVVKLKRTRLLLLKDYDYDINYFDPRMAEPRWKGPSYFKRLKDIFGIDTIRKNSSDVLKYYNKIEDNKVENLAKNLISLSRGLLGAKEEDIIRATKLYLALKDMMRDNSTNAITADCLNWLRHPYKLPIAPCLALSKFNDEGITAACEADVESAVTLAFCHYLAERPGFQSDPAIDESNNRITFAHCTAATKFFGYNQNSLPYWFRTHTESWKNVAIETEMPHEGEVTILKLIGTISSKSVCWPEVNIYNKFEGYNLLAYKAKITDVNRITENEKKRIQEWGCRTKISIELPKEEIEKFKENFYGHHRIVLYGDYIKEIKMLARFLGIKYLNKLYLNK